MDAEQTRLWLLAQKDEAFDSQHRERFPTDTAHGLLWQHHQRSETADKDTLDAWIDLGGES